MPTIIVETVAIDGSLRTADSTMVLVAARKRVLGKRDDVGVCTMTSAAVSTVQRQDAAEQPMLGADLIGSSS